MRSGDRAVAAGLVAMALVCALGNLWVAAERSTIPLSLGFEVDGKVCLQEKHPGVDDTCLLRLKDRAEMQVDKALFDALRPGDGLSKARFDRTLGTSRGPIPLAWSPDFVGLSIVMPIAVALAAFVAFVATRVVRAPRGARAPDGEASVA